MKTSLKTTSARRTSLLPGHDYLSSTAAKSQTRAKKCFLLLMTATRNSLKPQRSLVIVLRLAELCTWSTVCTATARAAMVTGPTAKYLTPLPRDYRNGIFKFTSTKQGKNATRDDLSRIIKMGIPGTYMPSFMLLEDEEVAQIVEYVRWLSMRGQVELAMGAELAGSYSDEAMKERVDGGEKKKRDSRRTS